MKKVVIAVMLIFYTLVVVCVTRNLTLDYASSKASHWGGTTVSMACDDESSAAVDAVVKAIARDTGEYKWPNGKNVHWRGNLQGIGLWR